jgi:hypothetical protein
MTAAHKKLRKSDGSTHDARAIDFFPPPLIAKSINGGSGLAAWTPATGKRVRLMSAIVSGATTTAVGAITFFDTAVTAGGTVAGVGIAASLASTQVNFGEGILISTSNALFVQGPAGLCNVQVMGQEETP